MNDGKKDNMKHISVVYTIFLLTNKQILKEDFFLLKLLFEFRVKREKTKQKRNKTT
jgi:hypothetical protein